MHGNNGRHLCRRQLRFDVSENSIPLGVGFQRLALE